MADMETHEENLERVSLRIAFAVVRFLRERLRRENRLFHADELRNYVTFTTGINAPASADRVMRDLRQKRQLDYRVVSRRESLYEALSVRPESPGEPPEDEPVEPENDGGPPLMPSEVITIQSALAECEARIERHLKTAKQSYLEIGRDLAHIRGERLYRTTYKTFDDYCQKRWGFSRVHAHRLIEAAEVVGGLLPMGNIPENERQARPLAILPPEIRQEVWNEAVKASPGGKVTEKVVREKAEARVGKIKAKVKEKLAAKGPKESEVEFLQRILAHVTDHLKQAQAIGRRTWNVDVCSKRALVQGLYEVFREVTLRLREFQGKPNRNGHPVSKREKATDLPPIGEHEETYDPNSDFDFSSIN